jgi:hypothetical protein
MSKLLQYHASTSHAYVRSVDIHQVLIIAVKNRLLGGPLVENPIHAFLDFDVYATIVYQVE